MPRIRDRYKYTSYKGWYYYYLTVKDPNAPDPKRPWRAWVEKPPTQKEIIQRGYARSVSKERWFAKRVSAKKAAARWEAAHRKRIETQRKLREAGYIPPGQRCGNCEKKRRDKDDYLCRECRYGF